MAGRNYDPRSYDSRWEELESCDILGRRSYYMQPKIGSEFGALVITGLANRRYVICYCKHCMGIGFRAIAYIRDRQHEDIRCIRCTYGRSRREKNPLNAILPDARLRELWTHRWTGIVSRCCNPTNKLFENYGGRGIKVHGPWLEDRLLFFQYALTLPGWDDDTLYLDRTNNDGHYEPGNLRLITPSESTRNTRATVYVEFEGRVCKAIEVYEAKFSHMPRSTFSFLLEQGKLSCVRFSELRSRQPIHDGD